MFFGNRRAVWLLFLLAFFQNAVAVAWFRIDHRPPRWDESHYLYISEYSYQQLKSMHVVRALDLHGVTGTKTGLVPFFTAISYFFVGRSPAVAAFLANSASLLLLDFSLMALSTFLFNTPVGGFVGALMFQVVPIVMVWSGYYQVDLPLTAVVAFTVMLCVWIDQCDFSVGFGAVLLFIGVAAGMGVKHLYVGFVALPLAYLLFRALLTGTGGARANLRTRWPVFAAAGAGVVTGMAYHLLNLHVLLEQIYRSRNIAATGATTRSPGMWTIFSTQIWDPMPGGTDVNASLLLAGALAACLVAGRRSMYLLLWLGGGWAAIAFGASFPMSYYFLPLLPAVTVMSAAILCVGQVPSMQIRGARWAIWTATVCLSVLLMRTYVEKRLGTSSPVNLVYGAEALLAPSHPLKTNPFAGSDYWNRGIVDGNIAILPYPQDWKIVPMLQVLGGIAQRRAPAISNGRLLLDLEWMSGELFRYELLQTGLNRLLNLTQPNFTVPAPPEAWLQNADVLIVKTGRIFKTDFYGSEWAKQCQKNMDALLAADGLQLKQHGFVLVRSFPLPDKSDAEIWASQ